MRTTRAIHFASLRRGAFAAGILAAGLAAGPAHAALIAVEDFESYAAGSNLSGLNGGSGWLTPWTGASQATVQPITLVDPNGLVSGGSQALRLNFAAGADVGNVASRTFLPQTDTLYMAYQIRLESFENDDFVILQASNGATGNTQAAVGSGVRNNTNNPFFVRVGDSGNVADTVNSAITANDNTDYLVVAKFSKDGGSTTFNRADLYVNPVNLTEPGVAAATVIGADPTVSALSQFTSRMLSNGGSDTVYIDSIRIATTFADALSNGVAPDVQVLAADNDAYVQSGQPNSNFNTTVLGVKHASAGNEDFHRKTWISFDTTGLDLSGVTEVQLQLTSTPFVGGDAAPAENWVFNVFGLRDDFVPTGAELDENWSETLLTYNNAPGNAPGGAAVDINDVFGASPLATFSILGVGVNGSIVTISDPDLLQFLAADTDGHVTFIITRATQEFGSGNDVGHGFASSESTSLRGPQLVLISAAAIVPEPSVAALGLVGLSALGLRRRRAL